MGVYTGATQLAFSRDGRFVAFENRTDNLVSNDGNNALDIFVRDRMSASGWFGLGSGLAGTGGSSELYALEGIESLGTTSFHLRGAPPTVPGAHVIGINESYLPLFGGLLVPSTELLIPFFSDVNGEAIMVRSWPANLPGGLDVRVQSWFFDPGGPQSFACSNALGAQWP